MLAINPVYRTCYVLVCKPSETAKYEQFPLISPHTNILYCFVNNLGLAYLVVSIGALEI